MVIGLSAESNSVCNHTVIFQNWTTASQSPILQYHAPPSWIEGRTKTRLDGHPGRHACLANMAEGGFSAAWSKSLRNVPFFDASFIETWLETDGEVPKKVVTRGYSNFCEGYIFDVEGKSFISVSNLTATLV